MRLAGSSATSPRRSAATIFAIWPAVRTVTTTSSPMRSAMPASIALATPAGRVAGRQHGVPALQVRADVLVAQVLEQGAQVGHRDPALAGRG